jgi:hypothetical protein
MLPVHDPPGQALGDRRFPHAGFAHQQRVVFAAAAERLDDPLQFDFTADQRVDLSGLAAPSGIQVLTAKLSSGPLPFLAFWCFGIRRLLTRAGFAVRRFLLQLAEIPCAK